MTRIKVVHVTTVPFALRYLCLGLLVHLRGAGYDVLTVSSNGPDVEALQGAGLRHVEVRMTRRVTPFADMVALWRLYRLFLREKAAIVHTHTPKANLLGQLAARLARVPVRVSTVHGLYFTSDTAAAKRTFFHIIESWSAKFADTVFLVNREDYETVRLRRICLPSKVRLLRNGIGTDLRRFDPETLDQGTLDITRASLNIPRQSKVVGFVGRLVEEKGLLELLRAAQAFHDNRYDVRFLIVGPLDRELGSVNNQTAKEYGVDQLCVFTGARDDMPQLYGLMDFLVLPSHREGCPRVVMEASAMRLPCIVTDIRGCRDVVRHESTGLVVPKGDVPALVGAIRRLLLNPYECRQMGERSRRIALERFDEREVFERVTSEYSHLLRVRGVLEPGPVAHPLLKPATGSS